MRIDVEEDRYHRQRLIPWWDQGRVAGARIMVVGAGAIGNEVLKLLALTGVGNTLIYDLDRIERSNLSRTVLFRQSDEGSCKAEVAAARMRELNPDIAAYGQAVNVMHQVGLGAFLWADVVIGCLDNREARVFVNSACARTGRTWIDGAIEGLSGVVRTFAPGDPGETAACYECTMNATDRKLVAERRSCAMLAREVIKRGHVPTTAVSAALVAALQVQEALKLLHGQPTLRSEGIHIDGLFGDFSRVRYPRRRDCPGHQQLGPIVPLGWGVADVTLGALLDRAERELGPGAALDLSRDVIVGLSCPACAKVSSVGRVLGALSEREARCPACGVHRVVDFTSSICRPTPDLLPALDLSLTPAGLGLPPGDIIVARRGLSDQVAWLFDRDLPAVCGPLARTDRPGP